MPRHARSGRRWRGEQSARRSRWALTAQFVDTQSPGCPLASLVPPVHMQLQACMLVLVRRDVGAAVVVVAQHAVKPRGSLMAPRCFQALRTPCARSSPGRRQGQASPRGWACSNVQRYVCPYQVVGCGRGATCARTAAPSARRHPSAVPAPAWRLRASNCDLFPGWLECAAHGGPGCFLRAHPRRRAVRNPQALVTLGSTHRLVPQAPPRARAPPCLASPRPRQSPGRLGCATSATTSRCRPRLPPLASQPGAMRAARAILVLLCTLAAVPAWASPGGERRGGCTACRGG